MNVLIFKLKELMAKYDVKGKDLADALDVKPSVISDWRNDNAWPNLKRVNDILEAVAVIGDKERLRIDPISLSDLLEWRAADSTQ